MTNFSLATNYAPFAVRYNPVAANGRSKRQIAAGRVIQVGFGKRGTVRMSVAEAKEFAVGLMDKASAMLPGQSLLVKFQPNGVKHTRYKLVRADQVMLAAGEIMAACREAAGGTVFAECTHA